MRHGVGHYGHGSKLLASLADGRDHAVRAHLLADLQGGPPDARSPEARSIANLHPGIAYEKPHRPVGPAFHYYGVIPGVFELGRELPAHVP